VYERRSERKEKDLKSKMPSHGSSRIEREREEEKPKEKRLSEKEKKKEEKQTENIYFVGEKTDSSKKNETLLVSDFALKIKPLANRESECEEGEISSSDEDESLPAKQDDRQKLFVAKKTLDDDLNPVKTFDESAEIVKNSSSGNIDSSNKTLAEFGSNFLSRKANPQSTKSSNEEPELITVCPSKEDPSQMTEDRTSETAILNCKPVTYDQVHSEKSDQTLTQNHFLSEEEKSAEILTKEQNVPKLSAEKPETNENTRDPKRTFKVNQIISGNNESSVSGQNLEPEITNTVLLTCDRESAVSEPKKIETALPRPTGQQTSSESPLCEKQISAELKTNDLAVSEPVEVSQNILKIGNYSSEDSFGDFASNLKATELPEDLTNVDTVELDSLIEAKQEMMRQLEEKQDKYLKKMKRPRQNSVVEESVGGPKINKETKEKRSNGKNMEQPSALPTSEESELKIRISLASSRTPNEPSEAMSGTSTPESPFAATTALSKKSSPVTHWSMTTQKRLAPVSDLSTSEKTSPEIQTQFGTVLSTKKDSPVTLWNVTNQKRLTQTNSSNSSGQQSSKQVDFASAAGDNIVFPC
jgi:hypothetical protein